jgi:hypothetical protein
MKRLIPYFVAGVLAAGGLSNSGCVARVGVGADVTYDEPELAYVSPGVWVVTGYNEPVFYHSNYYWVNRGGVWYRSGYYRSGWVRVNTVPYGVRRIRNRRRYVRYRPRRGVRTRRIRDHRRGNRARPAPRRARPRVRDHRRTSPPPRRVQPRVRDHRRTAPPPRRHSPPPRTRDHRRPVVKPSPRHSPPPRTRTRDHRDKKKKKKSRVRVRDHRD